MVEQWKEAGIRVKINVMPSAQYWNVWTKVPFGFTTWAHRPLGIMVLGLAYRTGVPWNESNWSNAEFDKLLTEAEGTLDVEKRRDVMAKLEAIMQDDGPIVQPLWRSVFTFLDKKVKGYKIHPTHYIFGNQLGITGLVPGVTAGRGSSGPPRGAPTHFSVPARAARRLPGRRPLMVCSRDSSSAGMWQAMRWPRGRSCSGGCVVVADRADLARAARANGQPAGSFAALGSGPSSTMRACCGVRVGERHGGEQRLGVGVVGRREDGLDRPVFDDLPRYMTATWSAR